MTGLFSLGGPRKINPRPTPTDEERKTAAWIKARIIPRYDSAYVRMDCDGFLIRWVEYGLLSEYGWDAIGGSDGLDNLRARHWRANRSAGGRLGSILAGR
jgi:hypothetical protein